MPHSKAALVCVLALVVIATQAESCADTGKGPSGGGSESSSPPHNAKQLGQQSDSVGDISVEDFVDVMQTQDPKNIVQLCKASALIGKAQAYSFFKKGFGSEPNGASFTTLDVFNEVVSRC